MREFVTTLRTDALRLDHLHLERGTFEIIVVLCQSLECELERVFDSFGHDAHLKRDLEHAFGSCFARNALDRLHNSCHDAQFVHYSPLFDLSAAVLAG